MGNVEFIEETPVKIYVILKNPRKPQKKPRTDVLEIACSSIEGCSDDSSDKFVEKIQNQLVSGVWNWLDSSGIKYYDVNHIEGNYIEGNITFNLNAFLGEMKGNCQDSSALYQVCCNALGTPMLMNAYTSEKGNEPYQVIYRLIKCFGESKYENTAFRMHIMGSLGFFNVIVFDPTCKFKNSPEFYYRWNRHDYLNDALKDSSESQYVNWCRKKAFVNKVK